MEHSGAQLVGPRCCGHLSGSGSGCVRLCGTAGGAHGGNPGRWLQQLFLGPRCHLQHGQAGQVDHPSGPTEPSGTRPW